MTIRRYIIVAIAILVFGYMAYGTYYYFAQTSMIFPADQAGNVQGVRDNHPEILEFWPEVDEQAVEAWYLPPIFSDQTISALEPAPLLVIAHGNITLIDSWPRQLDEVREAGVGVLLVEYPGYGRSPGKPGQQIVTDLFAAAYDSVVGWGVVDTNSVIALGRSLGGGVACAFSQVRQTDALILVSTFTSVRAFTSDYGLPGFLVRHPFDNEAVLSEYDEPVLLVHALDDTKIPFDHALALSDAAANDTLVTYDKDGHDMLEGHWDEFLRETGIPFLQKAGVISI